MFSGDLLRSERKTPGSEHGETIEHHIGESYESFDRKKSQIEMFKVQVYSLHSLTLEKPLNFKNSNS